MFVDLIDAARSRKPNHTRDLLIRYLIEEAPAEGPGDSMVQTLDRNIYG